MTQQRFGGLVGALHRVCAGAADRIGGADAGWRQRLAPSVGRALHVLTMGRGIDAEINGERFRIDPRHRVFLQPDYEAQVAAFLREHIKPGQCCFDVGAHIGAYALQMAHWCAPGGRVIAFEPNRETARVLRRHVHMNGLDQVVTVEELAVSATVGTAELIGSPLSGMSRLGAPNPSATAASDLVVTHIPLTTLDAYCTARSVLPDCLLIDVEGYEFSVLQGAGSVLRDRGSLSIVAEFHPSMWGVSGWSRDQAEALLRSIGRKPLALTGQRDPLAEYGCVALTLEPEAG